MVASTLLDLGADLMADIRLVHFRNSYKGCKLCSGMSDAAAYPRYFLCLPLNLTFLGRAVGESRQDVLGM